MFCKFTKLAKNELVKSENWKGRKTQNKETGQNFTILKEK